MQLPPIDAPEPEYKSLLPYTVPSTFGEDAPRPASTREFRRGPKGSSRQGATGLNAGLVYVSRAHKLTRLRMASLLLTCLLATSSILPRFSLPDIDFFVWCVRSIGRLARRDPSADKGHPLLQSGSSAGATALSSAPGTTHSISLCARRAGASTGRAPRSPPFTRPSGGRSSARLCASLGYLLAEVVVLVLLTLSGCLLALSTIQPSLNLDDRQRRCHRLLPLASFRQRPVSAPF